MGKLSDFGVEGVGSFYDRLKNDETYKNNFRKTDQKFIDELGMHMAHDFRYYQKQALAVFDFFQKAQKEQYVFKEMLYEKEFGDGNIPFYGFEMATGSGKTLLMGALILYLHKELGSKNFLIITPGTAIYDKTITNFDMMNKKCVFSNFMNITFNVVTGDNFIDKSSNYQEDAAFNIFIFNIQKFFDRETGTLRVDKEWEESFWRDHLGNTISFRDYLKKQKLVIITDEAHHYQKYRVGRGRKSSGDIILSLEPEMVLEFTATAVTEEDAESRRAQKVIYNYPINDFITDGYGKKVRAYGYTGSPYKAETAEVTDDDKKKFFVAFMIHLLKKKALEKERFKPILLVRARDIPHADNLLEWIQEDVSNENELIENAYNEIVKGEKFEVTELIKKYVSLDEFKTETVSLSNKSFVYHSDNEDDEEVKQKVDTIETNDQEVLIQIKKLEEGWDIQNPYTILILSLSRGPMKIYVKQLIGRGVRLFREKRRYDDLTNFLDKQQEILHVVCEKGTNFEMFIEEIRSELGLSQTSLETEMHEETHSNVTISEFQKYNELELPLIKIFSGYPLSTTDLLNKLTFSGLQLDSWVEENTHSEKGKVFWNWDEEEMGVEKEVTGTIDLHRGKAAYEIEPFVLQMPEINHIVARSIISQTLLPSHVSVKSKLKDAISKINEKDIIFKKRSNASRDFYVENVSNSIVTHIHDGVNRYFEVKPKFEKKSLKTLFEDASIVIKKHPETGKIVNVKRVMDVNVDKDKDLKSILIKGFKRSYYDYNWFESSQEFKLAYQLDTLDDVEFWIRNKRSYAHEYGFGKKYHPDFIVKHGDDLYIIEVKGSIYLETARTKKEIEILKNLRNRGEKVLFLTDKTVDDKIYKKSQNFKDIINNDDLEKF